MNEHDESSLISLLVASDGERDGLVAGGEAARLPKSTLGLVAGAMKRAFASALASALLQGDEEREPSLLVGMFQHPRYFEEEAHRYAAFAAAGSTVIAGFPGAPQSPAPGVIGVDTEGRTELTDAWVLLCLHRDYRATLVATDAHRNVEWRTLEGARTFAARWSFRRSQSVDAARAILAPLRERLGDRTAANVEAALRVADGGGPPPPGEEHLITTLESLLTGLAEGENGLRGPDLSERDLLTGLPNHRYLERWLGARRSVAEIVVLLLDVDDLGTLNDRVGREAGDAALVAIGRALRGECRLGDLLVRLDDDEFLLLAPRSTHEGAVALAERFVVAVRALRLPYPFDQESVTCSVAAAVSRAEAIPFIALRETLAKRKERGKDGAQVVGE